MKNFIKFILSIIFTCSVLSVVGCDYGAFPQKELQVYCLFDGDSFKLPVKFKGVWHMPTVMTFNSELSVADFKELIDGYDYGDDTVTTSINGNILVIEKTDSNKKTHYYMLTLYGKIFWFSSPAYIFDENGGLILFPVHYLDNAEISEQEEGYGAPILKEGSYYTATRTIADFVQFYSKLEECKVLQDGDRLEVKIENGNSITTIVLTFKDGKVAYKEIYD